MQGVFHNGWAKRIARAQKLCSEFVFLALVIQVAKHIYAPYYIVNCDLAGSRAMLNFIS